MDELRKYITIAPVVMEGFPDAHHVFLQVTNQRFCVTPHGCDTKEDAEWMAEQLCVALRNIVRAAVEAERERLLTVMEEYIAERDAAAIRRRTD